MQHQVNYLQPDGLFKNPAFSQLVTTQGKGKTIYIGGQDAVNEKGEIVGAGNLAEQTDRVMKNLQIALAAGGATFEHVVKLTIFILQGQDLRQGFAASQQYLGQLPHPPAITGVFVAALARPEYLVEIEAIAFVPET